QTPAEPRDSARLLVLHRVVSPNPQPPTPNPFVEHRRFRDLPEYLRPGDVLVANDTRVLPAKLHAERADTGQPVELLLLGERAPGEWQVLGKPIRRLEPGATLDVVLGRL